MYMFMYVTLLFFCVGQAAENSQSAAARVSPVTTGTAALDESHPDDDSCFAVSPSSLLLSKRLSGASATTGGDGDGGGVLSLSSPLKSAQDLDEHFTMHCSSSSSTGATGFPWENDGLEPPSSGSVDAFVENVDDVVMTTSDVVVKPTSTSIADAELLPDSGQLTAEQLKEWCNQISATHAGKEIEFEMPEGALNFYKRFV